MESRLIRILAATLGLIAAATTSIAGTVTYSDQVFNEDDWTLTTQTLGGGGSVSLFQVTSGGNPDEYRRIENTVNNGPGGVWGFHMRNGAVYDPSTQGAIVSLDYHEDSIMFSGFGQGHATGAALLQDGIYYRSSRLPSNQSTWTSQSLLSLTPDTFSSVLDSSARPDFSVNGGPITLGFFRANSTEGGGYVIDAGIDNWSITINSANAVPVPAAIWLFGAGLISLIGIARRNNS